MGSPYYYDVLFDDGPGDIHDCMWSGICTCCIQLLHQDSYHPQDLKVDHLNTQYINEPPHNHHHHPSSLKYDIISSRHQNLNNNNNNLTSNPNSASNCDLNIVVVKSASSSLHQDSYHPQDLKVDDLNNTQHTTQHILNEPQHHHPNINNNNNNNINSNNNNHHHHHHTTSSSGSLKYDIITSRHQNLNNLTSNPNSASNCDLNTVVVKSASSSSSSTTTRNNSPDNSNSSTTTSSSAGSSPKPLRRREHNDSERKRRDHLRNAFNFLRDQVPRFKQVNKKPPRIQILHEATRYVQCIMKESQDLERRLEEERAKYSRLKQHTTTSTTN